ncbi:hypothetical protein IAR50_003461 [Cryptococcus sp. DSM 104548]
MPSHKIPAAPVTKRPPIATHIAYLRSYSSPSHFHTTTSSYTAHAPPQLNLYSRRTTQPHILAYEALAAPETHALSPVTSTSSSTSSDASSTRGNLKSHADHRGDDVEANWQGGEDTEEAIDTRSAWKRKVHEWNPWIAGSIQIFLNATMIALFSTPPDSRKWFLFVNAVGSVVAFIFGIVILEFRRLWKTREVRPVDAFLFFAAACNAVAISFMFISVFRGSVRK